MPPAAVSVGTGVSLLPVGVRCRCSKSVPKMDLIEGKRVLLRAKADAPNWCKAMESIVKHVRGGKSSAAYEARGRVFESPRAYQTFALE